MSFGYVCKNNHVTQADTPDDEIVCTYCGSMATWQAINLSFDPSRLPKFKQNIKEEEDADKRIDKSLNTHMYSGELKISKSDSRRICKQCKTEFFRNRSHIYCDDCSETSVKAERRKMQQKIYRERRRANK